MDIRGKTALVTGGARRVGRQVALHLAQKGANVVLHYHRSKTEAEKTASEIRALGTECRLVQADLSKTHEVEILGTEASKRSLNILVNSASIFRKTSLETVSQDDWAAMIDTNLKAPFFLSKIIGSAMAKGNGGKIVNIADWSGFRPYRDYAPYCISKGGVLTLTKTLARDLAPKVQVNSVAPGPVLPPPDMSEEEKGLIVKKTLLGRWGSPLDIAYAVVFLIESDFINGTVLVVDGGRSIA